MTNEHGDKNERPHQSCLIKTEKLMGLPCVPRRPNIHLILPNEAQAPGDILPQYKVEDFLNFFSFQLLLLLLRYVLISRVYPECTRIKQMSRLKVYTPRIISTDTVLSKVFTAGVMLEASLPSISNLHLTPSCCWPSHLSNAFVPVTSFTLPAEYQYQDGAARAARVTFS